MGIESLLRVLEKIPLPDVEKENVRRLAETTIRTAEECSPRVFMQTHYVLSAVERMYDEILSPATPWEPPPTDTYELVRELKKASDEFVSEVASKFMQCLRKRE